MSYLWRRIRRHYAARTPHSLTFAWWCGTCVQGGRR